MITATLISNQSKFTFYSLDKEILIGFKVFMDFKSREVTEKNEVVTHSSLYFDPRSLHYIYEIWFQNISQDELLDMAVWIEENFEVKVKII